MANYIPRLLVQPNPTPLKMRGGGNTNVYVQNYSGCGYNIGGYLNGGYCRSSVQMDSLYYNNYYGGGCYGGYNYMPEWLIKAGERSTFFSMLTGLFGGNS